MKCAPIHGAGNTTIQMDLNKSKESTLKKNKFKKLKETNRKIPIKNSKPKKKQKKNRRKNTLKIENDLAITPQFIPQRHTTNTILLY